MAGKTEADLLFEEAEKAADSKSEADRLFDEAVAKAAPDPTPEADSIDAGSPLDQALQAQSGDVVKVDTPTGPAQFDRQGRRVLTHDEAAQQQQSGNLGFKDWLLSGALSLASGGGPLMDEMRGAIKASSPSTFSAWLADKMGGASPQVAAPSPVDVYRSTRDSTRRDVATATEKASPKATVFGNTVPVLPVAGSALVGMAGGAPATLLGRLGLGAALGAGNAAAGSEADLTKGDVGGFARDVGSGAAFGAAGAGVAEIPGSIARAGAGLMNRGAAAQTAKDLLESANQASSARGVAGSAGTAVKRGIDYIDLVLANPNADPEVLALARKLNAMPEVQEARKRIALNALEQLPDNIAWQQQSAQEFKDLASTIPQRAASATQEALSSPYTAALLPRAQRFGTRAALGAAGHAFGDSTGGMVAAAPGTVQMALNMMRDPRLKFAVGRDVERAFSVPGNTSMMSVAGASAAQASQNAFQSLQQRLGLAPKSKEDASDLAFVTGQMAAQPR